mmetsp:Transcript_64471/g.135283  ORF Transcript_64471/g.135283 Transcript_64471/m.135283 type:complete len:248 (-) Transcript_64471:271-1014(-)
MNDPMTVHVVQSQQHLAGSFSCILLGVPLLLGDSLEELATLQTLHDQVHVFFGLVDVVQSGDVGVVHTQEDLYLGVQLSPLVGTDVRQLKCLHCKFLMVVWVFTSRQSHDPIVPGAQHLLDNIVVVLDADWEAMIPAVDAELAQSSAGFLGHSVTDAIGLIAYGLVDRWPPPIRPRRGADLPDAAEEAGRRGHPAGVGLCRRRRRGDRARRGRPGKSRRSQLGLKVRGGEKENQKWEKSRPKKESLG